MAPKENLHPSTDSQEEPSSEDQEAHHERSPGFEYVAQIIDHTLLKLDATEEQVDSLCEEAKRYNFKSVCVRLQWVERAVCSLRGSRVRVACVVGFHEGTYPALEKAEEAVKAVQAGAAELDMVMNWHLLKEKRFREVYEDVAAVKTAASGLAILKVILETSQLEAYDIVAACTIAAIAQADFVKTSTGFCGQGATVENVRLMRSTVGDRIKVKASGGVRTLEDCLTMIEAGAERIGTSNGVAIMQEANSVNGIGANER
ncbi:MAG: hypothetical protein Q9163_003713 [Psora crenata]